MFHVMKWLEMELGNSAWILCYIFGHDMGDWHYYEASGELWSAKAKSCNRAGCRHIRYDA